MKNYFYILIIYFFTSANNIIAVIKIYENNAMMNMNLKVHIYSFFGYYDMENIIVLFIDIILYHIIIIFFFNEL